jgi:hypothetical protein
MPEAKLRTSDWTLHQRVVGTILVLVIAAHAFFTAFALTPNFDDGINGDHILSVRDEGVLFYNQYFDASFVVQKPSNILLVGTSKLFGDHAFVGLSVIRSLLAIVSMALFFRLARRYFETFQATIATAVFAYFLMTLSWLAPTRPEIFMLPIALVVLNLAQEFTRRADERLLYAQAAIIGLLAVPTHVNASILIISFLTFLILVRKKTELRTLGIAVSVLMVSGAIGIIVILLPDPSNSIQFLKSFENDGSRFTFLVGEIRRVSLFVRWPYYFYLSVGLAALLVLRHPRSELSLSSFRAWASANPAITAYAVGIFVALVILPSAEWGAYLVYYLPLAGLISGYVLSGQVPGLQRRVVAAILIAVLVTGFRLALFDYKVEGSSAFTIGQFLLLALPVVLLLLSGQRIHHLMLAIVIASGLALHSTMIWNTDQAFDAIADLAARRAEATSQTIVSMPNLVWRAPDGFTQFTADYVVEPGSSGTAVLKMSDAALFRQKAVVSQCSTSDPIILDTTVGNPFINPAFRNIQFFTFDCGKG